MATQPITSSLPAYVEQNKIGLIGKSVLDARTIKYLNVQTGCKGTTAINLLTTDVQFTDGKTCGFTPKGTQTFTQRNIVTGNVKVNMEYCAENFRGKFAQNQLRYAAGQEVLPFEQELVDEILKNIGVQLDKCIWLGDTSQSDNRKPFDGYIKILKASSPVTKTFANETSAYDVVKDTLLAIPAEALNENTVIFCSVPFLRKYKMELVDKNLYHFAPNEDYDEIQIPGSKVKLVAVEGLSIPSSEDNYLVAGDRKNFYYGCDLQSDEEQFVMDFDKRADTFGLVVKFIAGVQVAFPDQVVLTTISAPL